MHLRYAAILAAALGITSTSVVANSGHDHGHGGMHANHGASAPAQAVEGSGIVKAVDTEGGKVTLAHEAIPALKWPAMTMDFVLEDQALADGIKPGDHVMFQLKPVGDSYVISAIKPHRH